MSWRTNRCFSSLCPPPLLLFSVAFPTFCFFWSLSRDAPDIQIRARTDSVTITPTPAATDHIFLLTQVTPTWGNFGCLWRPSRLSCCHTKVFVVFLGVFCDACTCAQACLFCQMVSEPPHTHTTHIRTLLCCFGPIFSAATRAHTYRYYTHNMRANMHNVWKRWSN